MTTFADIVAYAKRTNAMTAAEMDYSLFCSDGQALSLLANAAYDLANKHLPVINESSTDADLAQRSANAEALIDATTPEREARIAAAKAKKYTGWSVHSTGPIRYAH